PFKRISYTDALEVLKSSGREFEYPLDWGCSLQSEHEKYLAEEYAKGPIFVTDYPAACKPFYMLDSSSSNNGDESRRTVACVDLLVPGVGELVGGSLREDDVDKLESKLKAHGLTTEDYDWYLDLRRFGSVPHGGFGMGLERYLTFVTGLVSVRDVIPAPRWYGNCRY
ncbi:hypothetical protein HDU76_003560, partial [Blyttiomyces sp. JEL0837]